MIKLPWPWEPGILQAALGPAHWVGLTADLPTALCRCWRMNPSERKSCGLSGIPKEWRFNIGCCYDPNLVGAWCTGQQCVVSGSERVDCGYPAISQEDCTNRCCCFDSSIRGVPWCFKPLRKPGKSSMVTPGACVLRAPILLRPGRDIRTPWKPHMPGPVPGSGQDNLYVSFIVCW
uniref:Trefoil factor 3 n=1 Tax=Marmota marmota marmota TaxID=9994 RepID=A0A8C5Z9Y5_MARMA